MNRKVRLALIGAAAAAVIGAMANSVRSYITAGGDEMTWAKRLAHRLGISPQLPDGTPWKRKGYTSAEALEHFMAGEFSEGIRLRLNELPAAEREKALANINKRREDAGRTLITEDDLSQPFMG